MALYSPRNSHSGPGYWIIRLLWGSILSSMPFRNYPLLVGWYTMCRAHAIWRANGCIPLLLSSVIVTHLVSGSYDYCVRFSYSGSIRKLSSLVLNVFALIHIYPSDISETKERVYFSIGLSSRNRCWTHSWSTIPIFLSFSLYKLSQERLNGKFYWQFRPMLYISNTTRTKCRDLLVQQQYDLILVYEHNEQWETSETRQSRSRVCLVLAVEYLCRLSIALEM